ncbi:MAG: RloB family protein [Atopobiaceae bacterium]
MAGKRRGRLLGAGRGKGSQRKRRRRYLVVTNGEVTEPEYLRGLESEFDDVVVDIRTARRDPAGLARYAKELTGKEKASNSGRGVDGFRRTFVVTDVDEFTARSLQSANRICNASGIGLVISNPCFEVWLIDYELVCPEGFAQTRTVERKAKQLGLVGGAGDKNIDYEKLRGRYEGACKNAGMHDTGERQKRRMILDTTDFGPWTDMPIVVKEFKSA